MAPDEFMRKAKSFSQGSDFIFIQIGDGLDDFSFIDHFLDFGDAIVVSFDGGGVFTSPGLDGVGVDGSLSEDGIIPELVMGEVFPLYLKKSVSDDFSFGFGIVNPNLATLLQQEIDQHLAASELNEANEKALTFIEELEYQHSFLPAGYTEGDDTQDCCKRVRM